MSDDLVFSDELPAPAPRAVIRPWQVLVVDDEPAVHEVTKLVMAGFEMDGQPLEFTHCYSAAEAAKVLSEPNEFALILLDVVMETDHAGLDLARQIREEISNLNVRIVLRTGQPGQAPEEHVIKNYDINDYKEKTDLTRRRLITVFYAGLRAYRDLMRIERARLGLRRTIEAISHIYDSASLRGFASAVLAQVNQLLNLNGEGLCASRLATYNANPNNGHIRVLAATEAYSELLLRHDLDNLPNDVQTVLTQVLANKTGQFDEHYYAGYFRTKAGNESVIYMVFPDPVHRAAHEILELFCRHVAITYDSLLLREDTENAQRATISILGGAISKQMLEPTNHLYRVGDIAALLTRLNGGGEAEAALMRLAAGLHDVGKVFINEEILTRPGPLSDAEWNTVKTHSEEGHRLLSQSDSALHALGATIAREHHEHWDGAGYPQGLKGEEISLEGRIVAIADVLDSLLRDSCYKQAWPLPDALAYLTAQSGKRFDPQLVALLIDNLAALKGICHVQEGAAATTL